MTQFDFAPLFRLGVGFDRLAALAEATARMGDPSHAYPPYNIEKSGDDTWMITLAVAGFGSDDLDVQIDRDLLVVRGTKNTDTRPESSPDEERQVLYRGIAARDFLRRFHLAEHVKVTGAMLENGLLRIALQREIPEADKPRRIAISRAGDAHPPALETQQAA